jgi:hypothetical protein
MKFIDGIPTSLLLSDSSRPIAGALSQPHSWTRAIPWRFAERLNQWATVRAVFAQAAHASDHSGTVRPIAVAVWANAYSGA